jgi:hypothetical protein
MHLDVPLTTVEQSAFDIGRRAVETLAARTQNPSDPWHQVIVPTRLVVRGVSAREKNKRVNPAAQGLRKENEKKKSNFRKLSREAW